MLSMFLLRYSPFYDSDRRFSWTNFCICVSIWYVVGNHLLKIGGENLIRLFEIVLRVKNSASSRKR
jgi:hypothetical protein